MKSEQLYLNIKETADRYKVSESCIWKWTKARKIPQPVKICNSTRWRVDALEEFETNLGSQS